MRILIYLLLGLLVLGAVAYGLRLLWYSAFPGEGASENGAGRDPSSLSRTEIWAGRLLLFSLVLLFLLLAFDRVLSVGDTPVNLDRPPSMTPGGGNEPQFY